MAEKPWRPVTSSCWFFGYLLQISYCIKKVTPIFRLFHWMLYIARGRHHSRMSFEFLNVGGWLARSDLALEAHAHVLAVAEHRLVPARARNVGQLRITGVSSFSAPACQYVTPGGHAGVGVVSLQGAPLSPLLRRLYGSLSSFVWACHESSFFLRVMERLPICS